MALSRIFVAPKNGQGGVKKSKKIFSEKIFERWKKIGGPLGPYLPKVDRGVRGRGGQTHGHFPSQSKQHISTSLAL